MNFSILIIWFPKFLELHGGEGFNFWSYNKNRSKKKEKKEKKVWRIDIPPVLSRKWKLLSDRFIPVKPTLNFTHELQFT